MHPVMLAKLTSKNQLTLPKAATLAVGPAEYFDVEVRDGAIVLTPVRIQRADAVRAEAGGTGLVAGRHRCGDGLGAPPCGGTGHRIRRSRHQTPQARQTQAVSHAPRVVLDTNAVLSALVFAGGGSGRLRRAWQAGDCLPLVSTATVQELIRVLAYPRFRLSADQQHELLSDYLPHAASVRVPSSLEGIPVCRDPFDMPFLQLAVAGKADLLVSGDRDLLVLADHVGFAIVTPAAFLAML